MAPAQKRPGVPLDPRKKARAAELNGMGLSYSEAAGACGISEKSVERLLKEPEYRKIADDVRKRTTSVTAQAASVVQELFTAVDEKGNPSLMLRQKGAELVMKNPALLESVDADPDDDTLPGVVLRFPWAGAVDSRDSGAGDNAEAPSAPRAKTGNGNTLDPPPQSAHEIVLDTLIPADERAEFEAEVERLAAENEPPYDPMRTKLGGDTLRENLRDANAQGPPGTPAHIDPEGVRGPDTERFPPPSGDTPLFTEADLHPES